MLRLIVRLAIAVALAMLLTPGAAAKCGNSAIVIDGLISGEITGTTVSVQVTPDPNWAPQPDISVSENGTFQATVYFDRTKSEGRVHDNCSRIPESVTVHLQKGGHLIDQATLHIRNDFKKKGKFDYELRSAIKLRSN